MEIQQQLTELFKAKDSPGKLHDTNSEMELKKIERQLNIHMKDKQGLKFKKITFTHDRFYDAEKFSVVIDSEIQQKTANKKWKGLPMFMKWKLLEAYFDKNNITDKEAIKRKLMANELEVLFEDNIVKKII
jgi:hypothetical protein